ncbi:hypothetical protein [Arthrobacter sp. MDT1-65]
MQNPFTDKSITREQRRNRIILAVVPVLIIAAIQTMLDGGGEADATKPEATGQSTLAQSGADAPERKAWAAEINEAGLESFGIGTWTETCLFETVGWPCYVQDMESPSPESLVVMLMVDGVSEDNERLGDDAAHALFKLVNAKEHGLEWIQVVDSSYGLLTTVHYNEALPAG